MDRVDPTLLSSPSIFLVRMVIFLGVAGAVVTVLSRDVATAFLANPFLNGLILAVLAVGIVLAIVQVARLFREVRWVNAFREVGSQRAPVEPVLLAPMAALLGDRGHQLALSPATLQAVLDSISSRLDEDRDISRYLTGLLVFLGLLGTFWGLTETVTAIGGTIAALDVRGTEGAGSLFESLKRGLAAPLTGMGTAFSSSLFGLAGSLVLGFLDLQAGQAQNRFYQELEEWLATRTETADASALSRAPDVQAALDRLARTIAEGGSGRTTTAALANLAEGVQGLVQHMRQEQQLVRDWVEAQAGHQRDLRRVLERLNERLERLERLERT